MSHDLEIDLTDSWMRSYVTRLDGLVLRALASSKDCPFARAAAREELGRRELVRL